MGSATAAADRAAAPARPPAWWRRAARHLARIRYRLLLVNVIVVAVPLVGVAFARLHERQSGRARARHDPPGRALRALIVAEPGGRGWPSAAGAGRGGRDTAPGSACSTRAARWSPTARRHPPEGAEPAVPHLYGGDRPSHAGGARGARRVRAARGPGRAGRRYGAATRLWGTQERVLRSALPIVDATGAAPRVVGGST
jgi:two-component system sensor histidine kinase ChvG